MSDALHALIGELEQDHALEQPERLRERIHAMDRLEDLLFYAPDAPPAGEVPATLRLRAQIRLEALSDVQRRLCTAIRDAVMQGAGAHALRGWVHRDDLGAESGYDHLDALIGDVLALDEPASTIEGLEADMVFYQPTPARHVFDLIDRAAIGARDVVVDLGSGMGHVPLLVSICTDAHAIGIEREKAYVESARHAATALRVDRATFLAQDVRSADFSRGTLFYLYTPFTGEMLREVLDKLAHEARQRPFQVATLGPCTPMVANEPWLKAVGAASTDRIALFSATSVDAR